MIVASRCIALLFANAQVLRGSRQGVRVDLPDTSATWEFEVPGEWDVQGEGTIDDSRVAVIGSKLSDDRRHRIYRVSVETGRVPHFTADLRGELEAVEDPVERTRAAAMALSNGEGYADLRLEGKGWFKHAGILRPSVLTVATSGLDLRELTTKVLQRAMRNVRKRLGQNWTTVMEDGIFHIGAHFKGGLPCELPQNHYHLMSPVPIRDDEVATIRRILQAWHAGPGRKPAKILN